MIKEYIKKNILLPRLQRNGILVVYDEDRRYHGLSLELESSELKLVDASESSIESREKAIKHLLGLGKPNSKIKGLLVYVPTKEPVTDEEKQRDPFALYTACGSVFPESDADEYINICMRAKPEYVEDIKRIFNENPSPPFEVIDALDTGSSWPILQNLLGCDSVSDILYFILSPDTLKAEVLNTNTTWYSEAKELCSKCLGINIMTQSMTLSALSDELWRFILFSEFCFDLPEDIPEALSNVPRAPESSKSMIFNLCERLRNDIRVQSDYIEKAEAIERELELPLMCSHIDDLGERDTFPFEEKTFMNHAVKYLISGEIDKAKTIISKHSKTVWSGRGESQAQWGLLLAALRLIEACDDYEVQIAKHNTSMESIINFYAGSAREVDRLHREFEQALIDYLDAQWLMEGLIETSRDRYRKISASLHRVFIKHLKESGWPPSNTVSTLDTFDEFLKPRLEHKGQRIAYILIDALRYELGVELEKQLSDNDQCKLILASSPLPTTTMIGMAALLPGAGKDLKLIQSGDSMKVAFETEPVDTVPKRMNVIKRIYGDRFSEMLLNDYVKSNRSINKNIDLLVLRSVDIDSQLTDNADTSLNLVQDTLKKIRVAVHKLKINNFNDVIIATDHGFVLNVHSEAGDVCAKPQGNWLVVHDRSLLGEGPEHDDSIIVSAEHVGIKGDFNKYGTPKGLVPYRAGLNYFHGGASIQEAVVPIIHIKIDKPEAGKDVSTTVNLEYKKGSKKITTRLPVIDVTISTNDLFVQEKEFEILLEAYDENGEVVGEAKHGGVVNSATGTVSLKPSIRVQVTMKMNMQYEGKVFIKALNPSTLVAYATLELETDYMV